MSWSPFSTRDSAPERLCNGPGLGMLPIAPTVRGTQLGRGRRGTTGWAGPTAVRRGDQGIWGTDGAV